MFICSKFTTDMEMLFQAKFLSDSGFFYFFCTFTEVYKVLLAAVKWILEIPDLITFLFFLHFHQNEDVSSNTSFLSYLVTYACSGFIYYINLFSAPSTSSEFKSYVNDLFYYIRSGVFLRDFSVCSVAWAVCGRAVPHTPELPLVTSHPSINA